MYTKNTSTYAQRSLLSRNLSLHYSTANIFSNFRLITLNIRLDTFGPKTGGSYQPLCNEQILDLVVSASNNVRSLPPELSEFSECLYFLWRRIFFSKAGPNPSQCKKWWCIRISFISISYARWYVSLALHTKSRDIRPMLIYLLLGPGSGSTRL